jgi:uncharacterized protein involved in response to NO
MSPNDLSASTRASTSGQRRDILGLLGVGFYIIFTLLPDSSSLLVSWPWVFIWQVALFLPWLWLLRQWWMENRFVPLGFGLDYGAGLAIAGLALSTLFAQFPQQARWYGWASLCGIAALYALSEWAASPQRRQRLLLAQGGLSLAFIAASLILWVSQTLLPELQRLQGLKALGLKVVFDFSVLELRNWAPIGHQNYVAGYLVLCLPLLLGLSLSSKGPWRWLWGIGTILGLVDLHTTSSRGGWLGLGMAGLLGIVILAGHPRVSVRWRWLSGLGFVGVLGSILVANNRLRSLFSFSADGGETAFRLITNAAGWAMGWAHPLFGAGPGGVPMLYQAYRPAWAGREAELVYQLHSTPAQIWAELGGWGIALSLGLMGWLITWGVRLWRSPATPAGEPRILCWSLLAGLLGYGVVGITDYQLDIVCISGTLIVYLAAFLSFLRADLRSRIVSPGESHSASSEESPLPVKSETLWGKLAWFRWGTVGLLLAVGIWLTPIHRAWQLSSLGFSAIANGKINVQSLEPFVDNLKKAQQLAPWEPYYSAQLGSNLVTAGMLSNNAQTSSMLLRQSMEAFQQTVAASPNQEFGHSSLGWLQIVARQPALAEQSFANATRLTPAKRGVFYSLGLSLLDQGKEDLAIQAMTLEIARDPLWLTSPVWRSPKLAAIAPKVQTAIVQIYGQLLQNPSNSAAFSAYLHQCLGGVYWWQGDLKQATAEWKGRELPASQFLLKLAQIRASADSTKLESRTLQEATTSSKVLFIAIEPSTPEEFIFKAWLEPKQRAELVAKALLNANQTPPDPKQVQSIVAGMAQSKSLDEWIKLRAPVSQYRRERAGFGVLSRHIDGPAPQDFLQVVDNTAMTSFFSELLPSSIYSPSLDKALQPLRLKLWEKISTKA